MELEREVRNHEIVCETEYFVSGGGPVSDGLRDQHHRPDAGPAPDHGAGQHPVCHAGICIQRRYPGSRPGGGTGGQAGPELDFQRPVGGDGGRGGQPDGGEARHRRGGPVQRGRKADGQQCDPGGGQPHRPDPAPDADPDRGRGTPVRRGGGGARRRHRLYGELPFFGRQHRHGGRSGNCDPRGGRGSPGDRRDSRQRPGRHLPCGGETGAESAASVGERRHPEHGQDGIPHPDGGAGGGGTCRGGVELLG